jgi:hypothetical protein
MMWNTRPGAKAAKNGERHAFVSKEGRGGISLVQIALVENHPYVQASLLCIDDRFNDSR